MNEHTIPQGNSIINEEIDNYIQKKVSSPTEIQRSDLLSLGFQDNPRDRVSVSLILVSPLNMSEGLAFTGYSVNSCDYIKGFVWTEFLKSRVD